jgi:hypothetical protein
MMLRQLVNLLIYALTSVLTKHIRLQVRNALSHSSLHIFIYSDKMMCYSWLSLLARISQRRVIKNIIYCDMTPEGRNSPLLDNGSLTHGTLANG